MVMNLPLDRMDDFAINRPLDLGNVFIEKDGSKYHRKARLKKEV